MTLFERVKERVENFGHSHEINPSAFSVSPIHSHSSISISSTSPNQETIKALCDILEEELLGKNENENEFLKEDEMNIK